MKFDLSALYKKKSPIFTDSVSIDDGLSIRDQALEFFDEVQGMEGAKENLYRSIIVKDQINMCLVGPPATGKTLLIDTIVKKCKDVVKFDASNSTPAGLFGVLQKNPSIKILVIDELDKLKKNDQAALYSLLNDGTVIKILKRETIRITIQGLKVFAAANSLTTLSKPLRSRFEIYKLKELTDEEFMKIACFCVGRKSKLPDKFISFITISLLDKGCKDIRTVQNIANKIIPTKDTFRDLERIISNWVEGQSEQEIDYNS